MKKTIRVILVLFICSISYSAIAQKSKLYMEPNQLYSKGRIYIKKSLIPITATKITLVNDTTLNYTDAGTGEARSMHAFNSSVNYVKVKTGTRAGELGLYGGALMGLSAVVAVLQTELDYGTGSTSEFRWGIIGGFTAGGFVIGGLIGVFVPKYKNFYINSKYTTYKIDVIPKLQEGSSTGLGVYITF
ncbi:MAG: hypothetical protein IH591_14525 [Bacteroidales bacterium]|nr:hypothetical protein [Bacteroidales bacterium]